MIIEAKISHWGKSSHTWTEQFDFPDLDYRVASDVELGRSEIRRIIKKFNVERDDDRRLISSRVAGPSFKHKWEKTNLVTLMGKGGMYDTARCINCGATSKRFGLSKHTVDKEKFRLCPKGK